MAWTAPKTWTLNEDVTHTEMNTYMRDNQNETAPGIASAAGRLIITDGANSIVERVPASDYVATEQQTTSTSMTDLTTAGPAVTVTTGTSALVTVTCKLWNSGANGLAGASFAVSGATTIAADINAGLLFKSDSANQLLIASYTRLEDGLTAGSNTFTVKYIMSGGTAAFFAERYISVIPF